MDKFEEHIRRIKGDLDLYNPPSTLWKRVEKEIRKGRSIIRQWLSVAAMIVIIFGTAIVLIKPSFKQKSYNNGINNSADLNQASPSLNETEIYYNNLVSSLYRKATPLLTTNPEIEKELTSDLSRLDSICSEIKKDLKDNIANQEVVEALIQNYRIKIRLLEDILTLMKENEDNTGKTSKYEL
jgi:hypothetical protein